MRIHLQFLIDDDTQVDNTGFENNPWEMFQQLPHINLRKLHSRSNPDPLSFAGVQLQLACVLDGFESIYRAGGERTYYIRRLGIRTTRAAAALTGKHAPA